MRWHEELCCVLISTHCLSSITAALNTAALFSKDQPPNCPVARPLPPTSANLWMSTTTIELNALDRPLGGSPLGGSGDPSPGPSIPPTPARSLAGSARTSIDLRSLNGSARNSIDFRYPSPPPSAITTTPKANYEYPPRPPSISNSNHAAAPSLSRRASEEDVGSVPADEIAALPPVDGGRRAWTFLAAATFIETTVWGLPYTVGVFHQYWQTRMFPGEESTLTLAATLQTALMYMSTAALGP